MKTKAFVINLEKRPDRWARCQSLWSHWFDLVRVSAVDRPDNPAMGCKLSHQKVAIQHASEGVAIVLEDDAVPTNAWPVIGMDCIEAATERVDEWHLANLGPFLDVSGHRAVLEPVSTPLWWRASFALQTHFMLYSHRSWDVLNNAVYSSLPLDVYIGQFAQTHARRLSHLWVPCALLATQDNSVSDIGQSPKDQSYWYQRSEQLLAKQLV